MTIRRYGWNKYGDGKLYGTSDTDDALAWDVSIDWDGDGFLESNEARRMTGYSFTRGRTRLLQDVGAGFESIQTGVLNITLRNEDGRFDAWNTSSPLYPNVSYGKDIRLRVKDLNTGTIRPRFVGVITNIQPMGYGDDARVQITASDPLYFLRNYAGRVSLQTNITPDAAIGKVLNAVNWPSKWGRSLDASTDTIPYWWASGDKKAMTEIEDLAESFLGFFFATASGQARFVQRTNISSSVASFEQNAILKDISNPQPYDVRRNVTRLKVHPRKQATSSTIYEWVGTPPSVNPGAANAFKVFANYTYSGVSVPALSPTISLFAANTQSDFLGTDYTASCSAVLTDFGQSALVTITNNSPSTVYIKLKIDGLAVYEPNSSDITYPSDVSSVTFARELLLDLLWLQDANVAKDLATVMGPFYDGLHPMPTIKVESQPASQFIPDLFDIVTVSVPYLGLDGDSYRVGGISESTDGQFENCQRVITELALEPYVSGSSYMQWDTNAVWDTSTVFGY